MILTVKKNRLGMTLMNQGYTPYATEKILKFVMEADYYEDDKVLILPEINSDSYSLTI